MVMMMMMIQSAIFIALHSQTGSYKTSLLCSNHSYFIFGVLHFRFAVWRQVILSSAFLFFLQSSQKNSGKS